MLGGGGSLAPRDECGNHHPVLCVGAYRAALLCAAVVDWSTRAAALLLYCCAG